MTWIKKSTIKKKRQPGDGMNYYHSKQWKNLRLWYITEHPLCERCLERGISRPSEEIHHIKPFMLGASDDERWNLLLNPNNLAALCERCHHEVHNSFGQSKYIIKNI